MLKTTTSSIVIGVLYALFLGALVSALLVSRQRVLTTGGSGTSQENWEDWRAEARRQQDGNGPVSRRVPKSVEPPSLVLLRDHFATSLAILLALTSALFFTIAIMVRGVFVGPSFQPDLARENEQPGRRR
ncbi:MAG: hypothetical protein O3C40_35535 [Planctomycetota bacterium]|nr:hypothetical protein [Planctomycetota bacterium]